MKKCSVCKKNLPLDKYKIVFDSKRNKAYRRNYCNKCRTNKARNWRYKNPDKLRAMELKRHYHITVIEYNNLLVKQGGKCAICGTIDPSPKNYFCVDHNHITGVVRGLLCPRCNVAIGYFLDNYKNCQKAARYLKGK
jgi:hypothetical protein